MRQPRTPPDVPLSRALSLDGLGQLVGHTCPQLPVFTQGVYILRMRYIRACVMWRCDWEDKIHSYLATSSLRADPKNNCPSSANNIVEPHVKHH